MTATMPATAAPERRLVVPAIGVGVLIGVVCVFAAGLESRWIVYGLAFLVGSLAIGVARDKERLLVAATVLALQADVSFRVLYGRANSGGLAFPLAIFPAIALLAWWAVAAPARPRLRLAGRLGVPIAAVLATSAISMALSHERFVGLTQLLLELELYLVYVVVLNAVRAPADVERIMTLLGISVAVQAMVVFVQSALGVTVTLVGEVNAIDDGLPFSGGTVGRNPAHLAAFLMPPIMIGFAWLLTERTVRRSWLVVLGLGLAAEALTLKRAAWAGLVLGAGWIVTLALRQRTLRVTRVLTIGALAAVLGAGAWGMMEMRLERSPVSEAYDERVGLMRMAMSAIEAHPLAGIGPGAYAQSFKDWRTGDSDQWLAIVHNQYLMRAAETGVPGLIAFLALLVVAFRQSLRLTRHDDRTIRVLGRGWSAALIALAWHMWWEAWQSFPEVSIFWLVLGLAEASERIGTEAGAS